MHEEMNIETLKDTHIYINESPLVPGLKGGAACRIKWGVPYILDSLYFSFDPDVEDDDKSGMEFL